MKRWIRLFKTLHLLNGDVVAASLASTYGAVCVTQTHVQTEWWWILGLGTWSVYTLDRIVDSRQGYNALSTERYAWHLRHQQSLLIGVLCALVGCAILSLSLPKSIVITGFILAVWMAGHILASQYSWYSGVKEIQLATIYSIATWGIVIIGFSSPIVVTPNEWRHFALFWGVVVLNQLSLNHIEHSQDRSLSGASLSKIISKKSLLILIILLILGSVAAGDYIHTSLAISWIILSLLHGVSLGPWIKDATLKRLILEWAFCIQVLPF